VIGRNYEPNQGLVERLETWSARICPAQDVFANVNRSEWQFVKIPMTPALESVGLVLDTDGALITAVRNSSRAQGFNLSPEQRRAIEFHAMRLAKQHFENDRWTVDDSVASTECYDLVCTRGAESLRVEVKGTTGLGQQIMLTANEVEHAETQFPRIALVVVHDIELNRETTKASGGKLEICNPWKIKKDKLKPISFAYTYPG
jgi:Domain of unknown function (DUF3883)